jgi:hypothetical protein
MSTWGSGRRDQGAWFLAALAVAVTTASLLVEPQLAPGLVLALDAVLLCLAASLVIAQTHAPAHAEVSVLVRTAVRAEAPRLRESAPGVPGHAWPRAPGRLPL